MGWAGGKADNCTSVFSLKSNADFLLYVRWMIIENYAWIQNWIQGWYYK